MFFLYKNHKTFFHLIRMRNCVNRSPCISWIALFLQMSCQKHFGSPYNDWNEGVSSQWHPLSCTENQNKEQTLKCMAQFTIRLYRNTKNLKLCQIFYYIPTQSHGTCRSCCTIITMIIIFILLLQHPSFFCSLELESCIHKVMSTFFTKCNNVTYFSYLHM